MYDLPPSLVQHASSGSGGGGGGGGGGRTAGGLAGRGGGGGGITSPPPSSSSFNNSNQHGSTPPPFSPTQSNGYGYGGGGGPTTSRSFPSSSLHHPQPTRPTPPPPSSSSSVFSKAPQNPSSPSPSDISLFHSACVRFFYHQDPSAQSYIESVLSSLPPSHRAAFTRVQAAVRSTFHADEEVRRRNEFEVLLRGTDPGGGLTVGNRRDPNGKGARREREERLKVFLTDYGGKNEVGPRPFLLGVWTALRLQGGKEEKGGAGGRRVEWEVDDAVWMEAGGKDFMIEAIAVVKGVLGFEDIPRTKPRRQHHRHQQRPPNSSSNSRSFSTGASSYSIPNSNGAGPSHRRPSDLEELRPTPEDDEAGPLYDSSSRKTRYASPPLPTTGGGSRRGKAPPIPSSSNSRQLPTATQQQAQQLSSSSSSSNPLISSRRRASSDPFSDPYANMSRQPPPVPPNTVNRRGPAPALPPPPPTRPHPTFLNLNLDATNVPSPLGGGALGSRSMSNSSSNNGGGFTTPNGQEDFLLPLPGRSPGGASSSSARSPSSAGPLLQQHHSASAVDDEDFSSDELSSPRSSSSTSSDEEDPLLPRWRTWIAPSNLSNPELTRLCRLFPSHITKSSSSSSTRFPYTGPSSTSVISPKKLEEGLSGIGVGVVARGEEGKTVGKGVLEGLGWTGRMWKGERKREEGWKGVWWSRFWGWLGRMFGG
ncbi:hypothetical protein BDY24DRAFT_349333 [Mrakia frigida]|uniref:uncharacterized protein n=1 Tax=Mrakia frigida TaxID=29902 RepID=UPI003FCBF5E7